MARLEKRLREQIRAELMKEMGLDPRRQRQRIFFQAGLALLAASGGEASLAAAPMAEYEASQGGNHAWRDAFRQLPEPQRLQIIGRVANDMARAGQAGGLSYQHVF